MNSGGSRSVTLGAIAFGLIGLGAAGALLVVLQLERDASGNGSQALPTEERLEVGEPDEARPTSEQANDSDRQSPPNQQDQLYDLIATIDDPDGYSNMRAGPSTDDRVITRIRVGQSFATYRQKTDWWRVRLPDGRDGWISRSRIRLPGEQAYARSQSDLGYKAAVINDPDGFTNIREGKSTETPIVARARSGDEFLVLPGQSDWLQVPLQGGGVGYIHRSRVRFIDP